MIIDTLRIYITPEFVANLDLLKRQYGELHIERQLILMVF